MPHARSLDCTGVFPNQDVNLSASTEPKCRGIPRFARLHAGTMIMSGCSNKRAGHLSVCTLPVAFRLLIHLPTFRHCRLSGAAVHGYALPRPLSFLLLSASSWLA